MALKRSLTTSCPNQNEEKTCVVHMITRLFIHNVFDLPGDLDEGCNSFLHTDDFMKASDEDISLDKIREFCTPEENALKLIMYLYIYCLIIEEEPSVYCKGIILMDVERIVTNIVQQINDKKMPHRVKIYEPVILEYLTSKGQIAVTGSITQLHGYIPRSLIVHLKIKRQYVGLFYHVKGTDNHAVVIADIYGPGPTGQSIIIKDTATGVANVTKSISEFFKENTFFIYIEPVSGGNSNYVNGLTQKDKKTQKNMLQKSRKLYKRHQYYTRKPLPSYHHRPSKHVLNARKIYGIKTLTPNAELAKKTGCSLSALKKIVNKGEGAYYSSGSRPNQTPQSWGLARLASSITAGNSSIVDYDILEKGCNHNKKAFLLAKSRQ